MSGKAVVAYGIPLTLSPSKGERNAIFNGLLRGSYPAGALRDGA